LPQKLNRVSSMIEASKYLVESDPQRWHWRGVAAARGKSYLFCFDFAEQVNRINSDASLAPVVFVIGRAALDFFFFQCAAARKAVDTWCLIALRIKNQVNGDVRKKIGMLIWETRELAEYKPADESALQAANGD